MFAPRATHARGILASMAFGFLARVEMLSFFSTAVSKASPSFSSSSKYFAAHDSGASRLLARWRFGLSGLPAMTPNSVLRGRIPVISYSPYNWHISVPICGFFGVAVSDYCQLTRVLAFPARCAAAPQPFIGQVGTCATPRPTAPHMACAWRPCMGLAVVTAAAPLARAAAPLAWQIPATPYGPCPRPPCVFPGLHPRPPGDVCRHRPALI